MKNQLRKPPFWLTAGLLALAAFLVLTFLGLYKPGGLCLAAFWASLAVLAGLYPATRSFSYTLVVVACVTTSMYFPEFYLQIGETKTTVFIIPILQIIMFAMGTQLSLRDFHGILKQPYGVFVGLLCQFTIMPLVGFSIAVGFRFEPEIAAGIILVGCVPCGIASNVMNFIAKANIALAVTLTAVATLLAPLLTPLLMKFLAGQFIEIEYLKMTAEITNLVIFPIIAGLMFQTIARRTVEIRSVILHFISFALFVVILNGIFTVFGLFPLESLSGRLLTQTAIFPLLPIIAALVLRTLVVERPKVFDGILSLISMVGLLLTIVIINAAGRDYLLQIGILLGKSHRQVGQ